jgi:hypothetical protein
MSLLICTFEAASPAGNFAGALPAISNIGDPGSQLRSQVRVGAKRCHFPLTVVTLSMLILQVSVFFCIQSAGGTAPALCFDSVSARQQQNLEPGFFITFRWDSGSWGDSRWKVGINSDG